MENRGLFVIYSKWNAIKKYVYFLVFYQELVADFLFVLCKENVNRLIKYTGYGNAAGLLASRGLMGAAQSQGNGGNYSSDDEDSETEEYAMDKSEIDPMIGEYSGSTDGTTKTMMLLID